MMYAISLAFVALLFLMQVCSSLESNDSIPLISSHHMSLLAAPDVICGIFAEDLVGTLTCPTGYYITNLVFASYGTATGTCPSFATSTCNSVNSASVMTTTCVGKTTCSFTPSNTLFIADPCTGIVKKLTVAVNCGNPTSQPSRQPTSQPSRSPSSQPSRRPTSQPTRQPTIQPSVQPSARPTFQPTSQPSLSPTNQPSSDPTRQPSTQPTSYPTAQPSLQPSSEPTNQPSGRPSTQPTVTPSSQPSMSPSSQPTSQPSGQPSSEPSSQPSCMPTSQPSSRPSVQPSGVPTTQPSSQPNSVPTAVPSHQPTAIPSNQPTGLPSGQPTVGPTTQPTSQPSGQPSSIPTLQPSGWPTVQPSSQPTVEPTMQPSNPPSAQPTLSPTSQPSVCPSGQPSADPSTQPSNCPTSQSIEQPSAQPSSQPSRQPSTFPTTQPSCEPTYQPSTRPSCQPTNCPSRCPSSQPTTQPSGVPSQQPTCSPSTQPTLMPSFQPSALPSSQPSGQPIAGPTSVPTRQPSAQPSVVPSSQPTGKPTCQPSTRPSFQPSTQPTVQPSFRPSSRPSDQPSQQPSSQPSRQPSAQPSRHPSSQPFCKPSSQPSRQPSSQPISSPTRQPSRQPTAQPSCQPSRQPLSHPSAVPTRQPSSQPSSQPYSRPSMQPISYPSSAPSRQPASVPSAGPSRQPASRPSSCPSRNPSAQPSTQPMTKPSSRPSTQPTTHPTAQPFSHPSTRPTGRPSRQPTAQPFNVPSCQPSGSPTITSKPTFFDSPQPTSISEQVTFFDLLTVYGLPSGSPVKIVLPYFPTNSESDGYVDVNVSMVPAGGETFVVYGNKSSGSVQLTDMPISQGYSVLPSVSYDYSSRSVSSLGDVNGDGFNDLIIGVPYKSRCYVMFGTPEGYVNMSLGFIIHGASTIDLTGWSVSSAGDVNNDTIADILVGAPRASNGLVRSGAAYIVFGSRFEGRDVYLNDLSPLEGFTIYGETVEDALGLSVSEAGDVNTDGLDDIVLGSLRTKAMFAGGAYLVYGSANVTTRAINVASMEASVGRRFMCDAWSHCGASVSAAGDVNRDGYDDLLIGSVPQKGSGVNAPVTYLVYGGALQSSDISLSALTPDHGVVYVGAGTMVDRTADINHDGISELMLSTGLSTNIGVGYVILPSLFVNAPTPQPSTAPTLSPTAAPTLAPTQKPFRSRGPTRLPTVSQTQPTELPSSHPSTLTHFPSSLPSLSTMSESEGADLPTSLPSSRPTEETELPTSKPSSCPSSLPTVRTNLPSFPPTPLPTVLPTTIVPTLSPTIVPRVIVRPTLLPTFTVTVHMNQTANVVLASNGSVERTSYAYRGYYTWQVAADVQLLGHGAPLGDTFNILPNSHCTLTIEYFNQSWDVIDLRAFSDIQRYQELNVTEGSVRITLPGLQVIHILNLHPTDLNDNNFLFAEEAIPTQEPTLRYQIIVVLCVCSVLFVGLLVYGVHFYYKVLKWRELKRVADGAMARQRPLVTHTHSVYKNTLVGKIGEDVVSEESLILHGTNENSLIGSSQLSSMEMGGGGGEECDKQTCFDNSYDRDFQYYKQKMNRDMNGSESDDGEEEKNASDRRLSRHSASPPHSFVISDDYNSEGFV